MIIKAVARQNWQDDDHRYATWYEPFDDQRTITAAVSWALSLPSVTGIATPGDVRLLHMVVEAEQNRIAPDEAVRVLGGEPAYSSPFIDMPW